MFTWGLLAVGDDVRADADAVLRDALPARGRRSGFFPGVVYYLMHWFPAHERGRAISRFYVALPISSIVMGSLAGMLLGLQGHLGLAGWQWLFLVEGLPAIVLSVVILFALPNGPTEARWLTAAERDWIAKKLEADDRLPGVSGDAGVLRALVDPRVWALGVCGMCILGAAYAFSLFGADGAARRYPSRCDRHRFPDRRHRCTRRDQHGRRRLVFRSAPRTTWPRRRVSVGHGARVSGDGAIGYAVGSRARVRGNNHCSATPSKP